MKISPKSVSLLAGIVFLLPGAIRPANAAAEPADPFAPADNAPASASTSMVTPMTPTAKPALKPTKTAAEAATDILALVKDTREDTAFVSTTVHAPINTDLGKLEDAANAVLKDDGKDQAATDKTVGDFVAAINQLISRVNSTANRPKETDEVKAKCHTIQQLLSATRMAFQPNPPATAPKVAAAKPAKAAASASAANGDNADSKMVLPTTPGPKIAAAAVVKAPTTTTEQLLAIQAEVKKTIASLAKSNPNNFDGKVDAARTDAATESDDVATALTYIKDHPELDPLPDGVPPTEKEKIEIPTVPASNINPTTGKQKSPNIANAVDSLAATLRMIIDTPKGGTAPLVLVRDLDGNRDKILADIDKTNQDIQAGFAFQAGHTTTTAKAGTISALALKPTVTAPTYANLTQAEKDFFQQQPNSATMQGLQRIVSPALGQVFSATFYHASVPELRNGEQRQASKTFARVGSDLTPMELPATAGAMPDLFKLIKPDFTLKTKTDAMVLQKALYAVYPLVAINGDPNALAGRVQQDGNNWSIVYQVVDKQYQGFVCTTNTDGSITSIGYSLDLPAPVVPAAPVVKAKAKPATGSNADDSSAMVLPTPQQ